MKLKRLFSINAISISILISVIGIIFYANGNYIFKLMELKSIDLRFKARGPIQPGPDVVLAVVDERSLTREGNWVWPRSKFAKLVNVLSGEGGKGLSFVVAFLEPDTTDDGIIKAVQTIDDKMKREGIENSSVNETLEKLKTGADNDRLLADAIKNSKATAVLGYFFEFTPEDTLNDQNIDELLGMVTGSEHKLVSGNPSGLLTAQYPKANIPQISAAANYSGFFNMSPDIDGTARKLPMVIKCKNRLFAPLSFRALNAWFQDDFMLKFSDMEGVRLLHDETKIPLDQNGFIWVNFRGGGKTFPHISITDILHNNFPENTFKDKIVLIGATAIGIYDVRVTPFEELFPGLEVHANIIDMVLSRDFLLPVSSFMNMILILSTGISLGFLLRKLGGYSGAIAFLAMFGGYIFLTHYLFSFQNLIINGIYPLLTILLTYISVTTFKYLTESQQKAFIKDAFSTYLAPSVVNTLIQSPEKLVLGGEEREITAFFSDVQGFTSISEKLSPKELVDLLNEFLTEMTNIILKYQGTVDKFEGDAIIAFFGAPIDLENQREAACMATIEMQKRLVELRAGWKARNMPELHMRAGMCTGTAVVGNMGSKNRMDYTMMGDTVNTAARLEGVNKIYGTYTMIGEPTLYENMKEKIITRELDSIYVVGKFEPVKIYEIIGLREECDESTDDLIRWYHDGLTAYRNQNWEEAIICFNEALTLFPDDPPSKSMQARCEEYQINPPGEDWKGAYRMTSK